MICDRIKLLRESHGLTQSSVAKRFGITRSSVNAWEMGFSVPSTPYIIELSHLFSVSTDNLLGVESSASVDVKGLTDLEIAAVVNIVDRLKEGHNIKK